MAKTISKLNILVSLSSKGLTSGVRKANGILSGLSGKLGAVSVALAGAAGVTTLVSAAMSGLANSFREVDEAAKIASRLNLTIASLEALKLAAVEGGSSASALTSSLQRMTRRVSEAAQGSGEAVAALKELGLSAEALTKLTADEQLVSISRALQEVSNEGDKTRLMMKLFDSEGVALKNTLVSLAESGMAPLRKEIRALGVLSASDAAGIEKMNDAWVELKTAMQGYINQTAAVWAPLLEDLMRNVLIPVLKASIALQRQLRALFGTDPGKIAGFGEEAALAAKTAASETSRWAEMQRKLKEEAAALAEIEKRMTKERAAKLRHAESELAALERMKETVKSISTPTVGAVGLGTAAAVNTVQSLIVAGRDRAAADAERTRKLIELAAKKERWLAEIARLMRAADAKPTLKVATHSIP